MSNRVLRAGFFAVPILSLAFGLVAACADEELDPATPRADASADVSVLPDGSNGGVDANRPDTGSDAGNTEDDADTDADAAPLPTLCSIYPNTDTIAGDAATGEGNLLRYQQLIYRVTEAVNGLNSGGEGTCEIFSHFDPGGTFFEPPQQDACLEREILALISCKLGETPYDYSNVDDGQGARCANGAEGIHLGFRSPDVNQYTKADVDKLLDIIRAQAITVGYSETNADRLRTLLATKITTVVPATNADAGFSNSTCP